MFESVAFWIGSALVIAGVYAIYSYITDKFCPVCRGKFIQVDVNTDTKLVLRCENGHTTIKEKKS